MFEELEYKYRAEQISLNDFKTLMDRLAVKRRVVAASWDIYFSRPQENDTILRFRLGDKPELTRKIKTQNSNNWKRVEIDLPLDPERITEETVAKYVSVDGYSENFRIFKACDIYFLEFINYVYYVVYDNNLKEVGRFVEAEVNKDKVMELEALSPGLAFTKLREGEQLLEKLGIAPQNRLKKSLFELYRKAA